MPRRAAALLLLLLLLLAWPPAGLCHGEVSLGDIVRNLTVDTSRSAEHLEITSRLERLQDQLTALQDQLKTAQSGADKCPAGWSRHNSSCYLIPAVTATWFEATTVCAAIDGRARLASVHLDNHQFVEALVADSDTRYVWVGGVQLRQGSATWAWQDGTAVDYTNWAQGQPNPSQEHCLALQGPRSEYDARTGEWHNGSSCSQPAFHFMCQITFS